MFDEYDDAVRWLIVPPPAARRRPLTGKTNREQTWSPGDVERARARAGLPTVSRYQRRRVVTTREQSTFALFNASGTLVAPCTLGLIVLWRS